METVQFEERLFTPGSTITVAGPSGSGKTSICMGILRYRQQLFTEPVAGTVYFYSEMQPAYKNGDIGPVYWHQGVPTIEQLEGYISKFQGKFFLMCFDDLFGQLVDSDIARDITTKYTHHRNFTCLAITQNIFAQGRQARNQAVNSHFYILTRTTRELKQISMLGDQMQPGKGRRLLEVK